jgi:hypothetical protein
MKQREFKRLCGYFPGIDQILRSGRRFFIFEDRDDQGAGLQGSASR